MRRVLTFFLSLILIFPASGQLYPLPETSEQTLLKVLSPVLSLTEKELIALVPPQSGFRFSNSPESQEGAQENNFVWELSFGDKVQCQFTKTFFPNEQFPENGFLEFTTPTGKKQRYNFHEDAKGNRYWYEARRWYEQRVFLERAAYQLAQLYTLNPARHAKAGRYAYIILREFARVYPDFIVTFEYPTQPKRFIAQEDYEKEVVKMGENAWRLAKWSWWAYGDVSESLLLTYDLLKNTTLIPDQDRKIIENDLFRAMLRYVDRYAGLSTTNMHPTLWSAQAVAANLFSLNDLIDSVNKGIGGMLRDQFTHDGFWKETTVSYHRQTALGLLRVFHKLYPQLDERQRNEKLKSIHPTLFRAVEADRTFRLPNGHYASINDTWAHNTYSPVLTESTSHLLTGTGYAVLGTGKGDHQLQAHLNFNGHFGHDHFGGLNLTLFGKGKELLSDIGYTHTNARTWATSSTAHNLVVINGKSQLGKEAAYNGSGTLTLYNTSDHGFQAVEADATNVYSRDGISRYSRALIAVSLSDNDHYVADFFTVKGPGRKDWILHGSADEDQDLDLSHTNGQPLSLQPVTTLVPDNRTFRELRGLVDMSLLYEPYWGHTHFKQPKQTSNVHAFVSTFRYRNAPDTGLQTWFAGQKNYTVSTAKAWSIRNTRENQGKLDDYLREALMVTSQSEHEIFAAVHVPFQGRSPVKTVSPVFESDQGVVLKISSDSGITDYLIYNTSDNDPFRFRLEGREAELRGRIGLIRQTSDAITLRMIASSGLRWDRHKLEGKRQIMDLIAIEKNQLIVEGDFSVKPGETILVRHGNGRITPFQIASVRQDTGRTIVTTLEPDVYRLSADKMLQMTCFPYSEHPGPHRVASCPLDQFIIPR